MSARRSIWLAAFTVLALPAYAGTEVLGPDGGVLEVGTARLQIPPGALLAPTEVTLRREDPAAGLTWSLEPAALRLFEPAWLTVALDPSDRLYAVVGPDADAPPGVHHTGGEGGIHTLRFRVETGGRHTLRPAALVEVLGPRAAAPGEHLDLEVRVSPTDDAALDAGAGLEAPSVGAVWMPGDALEPPAPIEVTFAPIPASDGHEGEPPDPPDTGAPVVEPPAAIGPGTTGALGGTCAAGCPGPGGATGDGLVQLSFDLTVTLPGQAAAQIAVALDLPAFCGGAGCTAHADCAHLAGACRVALCDFTAGTCITGVQPDGTPCANGVECRACSDGECLPIDGPCCESTADCAVYDDADLCNGTLFCDDQRCTQNPATTVGCGDPGITCQETTCEPATGACVQQPVDFDPACSDGDPCTDDACVAGSCESQPNGLCACMTDADCVDDGDLCNGTLYCDKQSFPAQCKVNPATVVLCPSGADTECSENTCDPATGTCAMTNVADGTPCAHGDPCFTGHRCGGGECQLGPVQVCECVNDDQCASENTACQKWYCDLAAGTCKPNPATALYCPSWQDTGCLTNTCDPEAGCVMQPKPDGHPCDDGDPCTAGDRCEAGSCAAGGMVCECTDHAHCPDDGDPCTGQLYCDKLIGQCKLNPATLGACGP